MSLKDFIYLLDLSRSNAEADVSGDLDGGIGGGGGGGGRGRGRGAIDDTGNGENYTIDGNTAASASVSVSRSPPDALLLELISRGGTALLRQKEDGRGRLPLHLAIEHRARPSVIFLLLELYPQAVFVTDDEGWTVFIYAARFNAPVEVFRELYKIGPDVLLWLHSTGNSALHNAIFSARSPCSMLEDAEVHTEDALILEMVTVAPTLCAVKGAFGFYPLHYAAAYGKVRSLDLIKLIYNEFPNAAFAQQQEGNLPLHLAVKFDAPLEVVQLLLEANPTGPMTTNNLGELPVHYIGYFNASLDVFYALLDADAAGATMLALTRDRTSILSGALSRGMADDALINEVISLASSLCKVKGAKGNYPLHVACEYGKSFALVQRICSLYPNAVRECNKQRHLPIQLAVSSVSKNNAVKWDVVRYLMPQHEDMPSNVCTSFLHSCLEKNAPDDIILDLVKSDHLNIAVSSQVIYKG